MIIVLYCDIEIYNYNFFILFYQLILTKSPSPMFMYGLLNGPTGHRPKGPICQGLPLAFTCKMSLKLTRNNQDETQNDQNEMQMNCRDTE